MRRPLDANLRPGTTLAISSLPAATEIVGTDREAIHVSCVADKDVDAERVHFDLSGPTTNAKRAIQGAAARHGNLKIRIEVPRKINLAFRMSAGEVKLGQTIGNKDIQVTAGQISVLSIQDWNYKIIDVSVSIGEVNAAAFGADKGGFFRSFRKKDPNGRYRLDAHVTTGQINLSLTGAAN